MEAASLESRYKATPMPKKAAAVPKAKAKTPAEAVTAEPKAKPKAKAEPSAPVTRKTGKQA